MRIRLDCHRVLVMSCNFVLFVWYMVSLWFGMYCKNCFCLRN
jgi:hypothetical protein